ncbi:hypothetical protein AUK40_03250 [Candidatus Wirthbacteria bacterium CG2_30_54_11]|uniref:Orotidine 5'-phosphate decarboxylase domain-containing protein n=1 Tax=Candidatus Wirthbacteria bacterium CG2_30_54_11 TaxID=1817892 RepID=A0A1J5IK63_9BACT|nr:MAG: hypothetical protein AUK40_03250 [Candidatus Wirthbacteria bacterium CG2_30_54_11]
MKSNTFLQLAFNHTFLEFAAAIPHIPRHEQILIEAGTPFIKREGIGVISRMKQWWHGRIVADLKVVDGAAAEVRMAAQAGASYVTASGSASVETLRLFIEECKRANVLSAIDMLNVTNPMKTLWQVNLIPDAVYIHRGRDEENAYGKLIQYKHIAKLKGKWDNLVGAAGGIDRKELQSAIFNGADIVVVNIVKPGDPWKGMVLDRDFAENIKPFLQFLS